MAWGVNIPTCSTPTGVLNYLKLYHMKAVERAKSLQGLSGSGNEQTADINRRKYTDWSHQGNPLAHHERDEARIWRTLEGNKLSLGKTNGHSKCISYLGSHSPHEAMVTVRIVLCFSQL